tara:strand:- start:13475 stop:14464 length:990 start_codon:yes stop_codon:yes gene_type:complete
MLQMALIETNFFQGKKVIVTGGAGFIGSHICEELIPLGADVYCLDNFSAGKRGNVAFMESAPNFHIVAKDVCDNDAEMELLFDGADIVFNNAASKKNICLHNPQKDLDINAGGTLNLLELSMKHGVGKFIHASTGSVYGEPQIFPTDETHPLEPVSYYGVSKLAGDRYVDVFHKLYGLDTTILRYFHVYGPRQESNEFGGVVSIFMRNITEGRDPVVFGHGNQVRSFTWVKDLVKVNLLSAMSEKATGQAYNAASGIKVSINDLAQNMLDLLDQTKQLKVVHGDPLIGDIMNFDINNGKVKKQLGVEFNQDFWGTLKIAMSDVSSFLGR